MKAYIAGSVLCPYCLYTMFQVELNGKLYCCCIHHSAPCRNHGVIWMLPTIDLDRPEAMVEPEVRKRLEECLSLSGGNYAK